MASAIPQHRNWRSRKNLHMHVIKKTKDISAAAATFWEIPEPNRTVKRLRKNSGASLSIRESRHTCTSHRTHTSWSNEETFTGIYRWQEQLEDLRCQKLNSGTYEIDTSLWMDGYERGPSEIKAKIKNLDQQYRKVQRKIYRMMHLGNHFCSHPQSFSRSNGSCMNSIADKRLYKNIVHRVLSVTCLAARKHHLVHLIWPKLELD